MNFKDLIASGANVSVTVNALDLREFFMQTVAEFNEANKVIPMPETYLTQDEVSAKLQVDKSTLWRWDKSGYLSKCRVGGKVRYRLSDIEKLMKEG